MQKLKIAAQVWQVASIRPDMDSPGSVDAKNGMDCLPSPKNGVVMLGKCLYKLP